VHAAASFVTEPILLVDPLGARIEVVDVKAHPKQTAGAQRLVDDQRCDLGSLLWRAMSLADAAISFIFSIYHFISRDKTID